MHFHHSLECTGRPSASSEVITTAQAWHTIRTSGREGQRPQKRENQVGLQLSRGHSAACTCPSRQVCIHRAKLREKNMGNAQTQKGKPLNTAAHALSGIPGKTGCGRMDQSKPAGGIYQVTMCMSAVSRTLCHVMCMRVKWAHTERETDRQRE